MLPPVSSVYQSRAAQAEREIKIVDKGKTDAVLLDSGKPSGKFNNSKKVVWFFSIPAGWWWWWGGCLRNRFLFTGAKPEIRRALGALWCVQNKRRLDYFWHAALCKCGRVTFTRALHALSPVLHDIFTHVVMSLTAHYDCTDQDRYLSPHA